MAKLIDAAVFVVAYVVGMALVLNFVAVSDALSALLLLPLLAISLLQIVLLAKDGQTIGKKALNIRIVMVSTGQNGGFVPNVLRRAWLNTLIGIIPFYPLVDVLFIFGEDERCIHDLIAGTRVIR